jgi:outer membrane receptor protein involved in Fe transport
MVWTPLKHWQIRGNVQEAFQRPALGDLYQPVGEYAVVTEANPGLLTEHAFSAEIGVKYSVNGQPYGWEQDSRPGLAKSGFALGADIFGNELDHAPGTVTIAPQGGAVPFFGRLPSGELSEARINIDRERIEGLKLLVEWRPFPLLSLNGAILFEDAKTIDASAAPDLVGKQVALVPRRNATLNATWHAPGKVALRFAAHWLGAQFEDDENTLKLAETVVLSVGVSRPVSRQVELYLTVENIGDARVETSIGTNGTAYVGSPRAVLGGARLAW